jgi:hypothetical protein
MTISTIIWRKIMATLEVKNLHVEIEDEEKKTKKKFLKA